MIIPNPDKEWWHAEEAEGAEEQLCFLCFLCVPMILLPELVLSLSAGRNPNPTPHPPMNTHDDATHEVLLGLGANLGEPVRQLAEAVHALAPFVQVDAVSSVYRSEPVGFAEQPDFYNVVVRGRTGLPPLELLHQAQRVEDALGRRRSFDNAPRTLDVDLLAHGEAVMRTPELTLPHPRLHLRGFVLHPLVEIAPEWPHPVLARTARELLSAAVELERVQRVGALPGLGAPLAPARPPG